MNIKKAKFICSSTKLSQFPNEGLPEYAFIGRSNVGKSSLINMLTRRRDLAKTSSKPGKTRLINHFKINDEWYLVDLPGYGHVNASKSDKKEQQQIIINYIQNRESMFNLFVLLDSRHEPHKIDLEFMKWLGESGIPFGMVFTKVDKLSGNKLDRNLTIYRKKMLENWERLPVCFVTSSKTRAGKKEILDYINQVSQQMKNSRGSLFFK